MGKRKARRRSPCLGLLLCALPGIVAAEYWPCELRLALVAIGCFAFAAVHSRRALPACLCVCAIFMVRHDLAWWDDPGRTLLAPQGIVQVRGVVISDPLESRGRIPRCRFEMQVRRIGASEFDCRTAVRWTGPAPAWGDEVEVIATVAPIPAARNPGEFDLAAYDAHRGIFAELAAGYAGDCRILDHNRGSCILAWARRARAWLDAHLTRGIADDVERAGLIRAITLGIKESGMEEERDLFQHVGALHLFVINGLHIALFTGIAMMFLHLVRIRRRLFALVIIPLLFSYALVTGLNPGSVRAAIMAAIIFGAAFVERDAVSFNSLAAAALVLLAWDSNELFHTGFQFSFVVVAAIILLSGHFQRFITPLGQIDPFLPRTLWTRGQRWWSDVWHKFASMAGMSLAASIGSLPMTASYFNLITPSGFLANLILVPIAGFVLTEGVFALLTFFLPVSVLFNNMNWLFALGMHWIVRGFAWLPGAYLHVALPHRVPECRVTVLDLAPGQAVVIQAGGGTWLVDCGSPSAYSRAVKPFLIACGVNRLDGFFITHGASDAMGAYADVIHDFAPRAFYESRLPDRSPARRAFHAAAAADDREIKAGDTIPLAGGVTCAVLFPPADLKAARAADKSLALRIEDGPARVLLMSDSGFPGERWLVEHRADVTARVLVLGGQSQEMQGTRDFIGAVRPAAVIRGAAGFRGGPENEEKWVGRLGGLPAFLQSQTGGVQIDMDHHGADVTGFVNGQRFTSRNE